MGKKGMGIGGFLGGMVGFVVGGIIPAEGNATMSFFSRLMTGNVIVIDPDGFFISSIYALLAVVVLGTAGSIIGALAEEVMRNN